jgi:hypothetical protein
MDCMIGVYSTRLLCRSSSFHLDDESPLPLSGVISARVPPMFSHLEDREGQNHDCGRFLSDCAFFPLSALVRSSHEAKNHKLQEGHLPFPH